MSDDELEVFEDGGMRMVKLPLAEVALREEWNVRGEPSEEEVAAAVERFREQPMLHPPTVARRDGGWVLISGVLRFYARLRLGHEHGVFRWVEGTDEELLLLNLAENVARRRLPSHVLVERIAYLRMRAISAKEIAKHCGYSTRYVRQLVALRRDAHPELWALFAKETPHLTLTAMLDLVAHPAEEQLERWLEAEKHWRRGATSARGFAEDEDAEALELAAGATPRRRFPARREVQRLLQAVMTEDSLADTYREGARDALRWILFSTDFPTRFSWSTLRSLDGRSGGKVIPIRPGVQEQRSPEASGASSAPDAGADGAAPDETRNRDQGPADDAEVTPQEAMIASDEAVLAQVRAEQALDGGER